MSRYVEDDEERYNNQSELWTNTARLALKGKRGRRALADLRDALLALPEKRLISGALSTVGIMQRPEVIGDPWAKAEAESLVARDGEGVCAVGAYLWWQKVKAGAAADEAFAALPLIMGEEVDGLHETATVARSREMTFALAWQLAYRNDEETSDLAPEERYQDFLQWIDRELAP